MVIDQVMVDQNRPQMIPITTNNIYIAAPDLVTQFKRRGIE
jgi:hypothetical protein